MKFRIVEEAGLYWPQVKGDKWYSTWKSIPVRLHTFGYRWVDYASSELEARNAIERFKVQGDVSLAKVIEIK